MRPARWSGGSCGQKKVIDLLDMRTYKVIEKESCNVQQFHCFLVTFQRVGIFVDPLSPKPSPPWGRGQGEAK